MPLVKALRALLLLVAFLAVVPAQAGGALAMDDIGFSASSKALLTNAARDDNRSAHCPRANFVAPDDGTTSACTVKVVPPATLVSKSPAIDAPVAAPAPGMRLERPPKSV
jgi:hypothetical protein